jgi:hypothetical protein
MLDIEAQVFENWNSFMIELKQCALFEIKIQRMAVGAGI